MQLKAWNNIRVGATEQIFFPFFNIRRRLMSDITVFAIVNGFLSHVEMLDQTFEVNNTWFARTSFE